MNILWMDFLNSDWHDYRGSGAREDRIDQDSWLDPFLQRTAWALDRLPSPAERGALKALRAQVRDAVERWRTGQAVPLDRIGQFNAILSQAPLVRQIDGAGGVALRPSTGDIRSVLGEVVASLAALLAEGEPTRVKVCANPDCGWYFYDESRNQSRRWCSSRHCGNLVKVRSFRERHRRPPRDVPSRRCLDR